MLRCALTARPISRPLLVSVLTASPRRNFFLSHRLRAPGELSSPVRGSEGPHSKDVPATTPRPTEGTEKPHTGDWVLFHPVYAKDEVTAFKDVRRKPVTISDHAAAAFVWTLRKGFDVVSRYKHKDIPKGSSMSLAQLRAEGYTMDEHSWLNRILFLESIAGVPGMVAATCRHLRSLRLMRRDSGWIHTLLEEAENERMHLMTFMTLRNPGFFFRAMILGAQGVFYNCLFIAYIISPKTAHRFVGLLEEQACWTYTRCIEELEAGHIPEWADKPAPQIAIDYWRLAPSARMLDVLYAVRADETTHRFVNHTLANLDHARDVNPFAIREPTMQVKGFKPGFTREEAEAYVKESHELVDTHAHGPGTPGVHYGSPPTQLDSDGPPKAPRPAGA